MHDHGAHRFRTGESRWQYTILWRYGALLVMVVGLLAMGFGASGVCGTAISVTLLPIGLVCLLTGVVLPKIEGRLTAGPSGVSANLLAVHKLDAHLSYTSSGPAVEIEAATAAAIEAPPARITIGDVWEAIDEAGLRSLPYTGVGLGHAYFRLDDGRQLSIPNRGFWDHGVASADLLAVLATWGIHPSASGKYPVPPSYTHVPPTDHFVILPRHDGN